MFEIVERDAAGRICTLETQHGVVTTPTVLPVINPGHMPVTPGEMREMGAQAVITNAYIIHRSEDFRSRALADGVHSLIDFDGPVMTDSGSFQMYTYGDVDIDPVDIVRFQRDIGSDIGTILDLFSADASPDEAERQVDETVHRARRSVSVKDDMLLAATVQGGTYPGLRERCAAGMASLAADVYPIGGVVPLMERQRYADLAGVIIASKKGLPPGRPVHLFGAGHPMVFALAVALGCDLFDSAAYVKFAMDGRLLYPDGTRHLEDMEELACACPVCTRHTADELRGMERGQRVELLARHNLWQTFAELRCIREAIRGGWLWELVERRAAGHPALLDAMDTVAGQRAWLERWEPLSTSRAFMYTGHFSLRRPVIERLHRRLLERFRFHFPVSVVVDEPRKPYTVHRPELQQMAANVLVDTSLGLLPLELEDMYPVAQSVFPVRLDAGSRMLLQDFNEHMLDRVPRTVEHSEVACDADGFNVRKIRAVADMQFGCGAADALFDGSLELVTSKRTGKVRNVFCDGEHVVSLRARDGLFTLKIAGAARLHEAFDDRRLCIVMDDEAVPYVRDGKSVFARFVADADPELRPGDEAVVVDENDMLIGVGQCRMNRDEMLSFPRGMAAKTREGIPA
ncbi:MAG: tRNA guanosine(15) transglycosylase TgtA [Thermoplasmatota archaeon]